MQRGKSLNVKREYTLGKKREMKFGDAINIHSFSVTYFILNIQ